MDAGFWASPPACWSTVIGKSIPSKLAGPIWVEDNDADHGYLDRYFNGWIDLRKFKLLDYAALARLIIAYIDDARAMDDREALNALDRRSKT